jgi:hypothetical protein
MAVFHTFFNWGEHKKTADGLTLLVDGEELPAESTPLPVDEIDSLTGPTGFTLTYGQVTALGGDFYGDANQPICTAQHPDMQFKANFNLLARSQAEVQAILAIVAQEVQAVADATASGEEPSGAYERLPSLNKQFTIATKGRYLALANSNFDHFGGDAVTAYRAAHAVAQGQAVVARFQDDDDKRRAALLGAYAVNAFADHFLTDMFASGHVRTPRRHLDDALKSIPIIGSEVAGLLSKWMHDEDNKLGLWVTNATGDKWVAYGDARYGDTWDAANRVIIKAAVQQSMTDVWNSFRGSGVADRDASSVLAYVATMATSGPPSPGSDPDNWVPLFAWDQSAGALTCRPDLHDVADTSNRVDLTTWFSDNKLSLGSSLLSMTDAAYMPESMYAQNSIPYPPDETGPDGEYGWPPQPGTQDGPKQASGPTLDAATWSWSIDGAGGPVD